MTDGTPQARTGAYGWWPILLLLASVVSASCVLGGFRLSAGHGFPNTPSTTLLLLLAAASANGAAPARYKWSIVTGLGLSMLGDYFLMLPTDRFVPGLASFLVAQICYIWAFTSDSPVGRHRAPFVLSGAWAAALVVWLWPGVPAPLRLPVVFYAATLSAMAAQAGSRAMSKRDTGSLIAAAGAALFVMSDSALAFQRFNHRLEWGRFLVLGTYFAAQTGIALSVASKPSQRQRIATTNQGPIRAQCLRPPNAVDSHCGCEPRSDRRRLQFQNRL